MNVKDKRKNNRIQGGWGKSGNKKTVSDKNLPADDIVFEYDGICPQFDAGVTIDVPCKFIEIKSDGEYNLNDDGDIIDAIPATIKFVRAYKSDEESKQLFDYFMVNLPWLQRTNATTTGEEYVEPRETCWYGLPYSYSKVKMPPNSNWDPKLKQLLDELQPFSDPNKPFNSVMCNLYRDAKHSIDWHSDNEKSLGKQPTIVSLSLGATRVFEMCKRKDLFPHFRSQTKNTVRSRNPEEPPFEECSVLYSVFLRGGSLLTMEGSVQDHWLHRVPKEYHDHNGRINFTFRHIIDDSSSS